MVKQWERAITGLSGVVGDGARGQISRGTWETRRGGLRERADVRGECITLGRLCLGVGPAHSSGEAGNYRGAKGPERKHAESEGGNSAWTKVPLRNPGRKAGGMFPS